MPHVIETASSGRAKCRGCDQKIAKGELRFGERVPNMFGEGEMTLWFHLLCAAYKRPEPFLEALTNKDLDDAEFLVSAAEFGIAHRRLPRVNGAQRAPTAQARCRNCRQRIERKDWRIPLVYFEEFRFEPSGFVHASCAGEYFETTDFIDRIKHFSPQLSESDINELKLALASHSQSMGS
ncbi:MAG: PARP-type zinc finger-containing protein [Methyloceanibacter sp.]